MDDGYESGQDRAGYDAAGAGPVAAGTPFAAPVRSHAPAPVPAPRPDGWAASGQPGGDHVQYVPVPVPAVRQFAGSAGFCLGFGILAMFTFGLLGVVSVPCGVFALRRIKREPGLMGRNMAITGLCLTAVGPLLLLVSLAGSR